MSELFVPKVGAVFSADIAVPEHEREVRFYAHVLSTGDDPLWRADDLMNNQGIPIIGLGARSGDYAELPLQWMPHIQVADVAGSVERALAFGGSEVMHQKDDDGASQWAVLLDPNGAAFGLIPVVSAEEMPPGDGDVSTEAKPPVGHIAGLDITVANAEVIRDFYREVVGWSMQELEMEDGDGPYADYFMLAADGTPAAGVCHARGVNTGLPPVWMIYLPVGDLAESLRRVESEGGKVIKTQRGDDGKYAYAAIQDPVGAYLGLLPASSPDPDA